MNKVKKDLWNKLHQVKSAVSDQAVNLAQTFQSNVVNRLPANLQD